MRRRPRQALAVAALAAAAALATAGAVDAAPRRAPATTAAPAPRPFLDVRDGSTSRRPPSQATRTARARLRSAGAFVDVDEATGTLRALGKPRGTLAGPAPGDAESVARRYVRDHLPVLGLAADDLSGLRRQEETPLPGGVRRVRFRQYAGDIPAFDSGLDVVVGADGAVRGVLGPAQPSLTLPTASPRLSAGEALRALMRDVGASRSLRVRSGPSGARRATTFADGDGAALVAFPDGTGTQLGWRVDLRAGPRAHYIAVVDATSGRVLYRANQVKFAGNQASVWEQYPGSPSGGTAATVDLTRWLDSTATTTRGPNAIAWADVTDDDAEAGVDETTGRSGSADFVFPFTPFTQAAGACETAKKCGWDFGDRLSWRTNRRQATVQAFYYVNRFHDHLKGAPIGFTPADGNFEGTTSHNGDPLHVNVDDGALAPGWDSPCTPLSCHANNAFMDTPPDGESPLMAMFLFFRNQKISPDAVAPDFRDVNGADDAAIVYHEYTHGLSSRLITTAGGDQALNGDQPGAMGEGWSDWYAKDFLVDEFPGDDSSAPGEVDMGRYVDSVPHSIRSQALDCPAGGGGPACPGSTPAEGGGQAGPGGFTYGDFGRIAPDGSGGTEPEVHADGEIWAETLWDLRAVTGSDVAEAIITQGMRLSPPEPSFLAERDAILQADGQLFGGAHQNAIWDVFAHRGMGVGATAGPVRESFDRPATGQLAASPSAVSVGQPVAFDASRVRDTRGQSVTYGWDFDGNGSIDRTTPSPQTSFAYAAAGRFVPRVAVRFADGGAARAAATVDVAAAPTPSPTPTPTPGPTLSPPRISLPLSGRKARVRFTVRCDAACSGTAKLTVTRAVARKLHLGGKRTVATKRFSLAAAGRKTFSITLTTRVRRAMKGAGVKRVLTKLSVTARDTGGRRASDHRAVSVRRA